MKGLRSLFRQKRGRTVSRSGRSVIRMPGRRRINEGYAEYYVKLVIIAVVLYRPTDFPVSEESAAAGGAGMLRRKEVKGVDLVEDRCVTPTSL